MTELIWAWVVLTGFEVIAQVAVLASGYFTQRTPGPIAVAMLINVCLLCWAAAVLS